VKVLLPGTASVLRDRVEEGTVNRRSRIPHPFLLAAILQYADYFQTWTLVSRFGIGVEGNPFARLTWDTPWGWIIKLLIVPATLMIVEFHPSLQSYKDRSLYGMIVLVTSLIVVGIGFYAVLSKIILQV